MSTVLAKQARTKEVLCLASNLLDDVFIEAQALGGTGTAHTRNHVRDAAYFSGLPESASIF